MHDIPLRESPNPSAQCLPILLNGYDHSVLRDGPGYLEIQ
jgi:hypothetical protein